MEKMKRIAGGLDTFFKIIYRLGLVAMTLALIVAGIAWILCLGNPAVLNSIHMDLQFGGITFRVADSVQPGREYGFWLFLQASVLSIAQLPIFCLMFRNIRGILAPMKEGRPFDEHISEHLKTLGWLTVANGMIAEVSEIVLQGNFLAEYDLGALFLSDKITRVTTSYHFDVTFVIYALVLFLLAAVFHYGTQLQQLSDETL